jgi:hypothetical protein
VDTIVNKFCATLLEELKTSIGSKEPESYVERYGKESPGCITFNELREIYLAHVYYPEQINGKSPMPAENLLRALFNTISGDQRSRITKNEFATFLKSKKPPTFLKRLEMKIRRGAGRLLTLLKEECQDADIPFGCNGLLPLSVF